MNEGSKKKLIHEAFKSACLGADFSAELTTRGLDPQAVLAAMEKYVPGSTCRGCGLPVTGDDFAIWTTYWWSHHFPSHKACREPGMKEEAYECQLIDADCNDCRHFRREGGNKGLCAKTSLPVIAHPVFCSGHQCFEHRKSPQ